jgi:MFS family permease
MPQDFRRLVYARVLFTLAVQMQAIMLGWRMYELTSDPFHLGCIGLAEAVPALGLALWAGYLVDRSHPLRVYRLVLLATLVSAVLFLLAQLPGLQLTVAAQVAMLYSASFCTGLARAFSQPAVYAAVPRLVPRGLLGRASAYSNSLMQAARVAGPACGGLLLGTAGPLPAAGGVCALLVCGGACLLRIRPFALVPPTAVGQAFAHELLLGARFVLRHPILLPALSLDMLSVLFGGVTALLPLFAREILHLGPNGLGLLRAAPALGAVLCGLVLTRRPPGRRAGPALFAAVTGFGACILVFGLSTHVGLSVAALTLSGAFDSVSMVIRSTAVQLASPDALRGRISAVNAMFIGSSNELGEFESGLAASFFGAVPAVLLGGGLCLATVALVALLSPALRRLDLHANA